MTTFIVAVICGAACTALGIWVGRRNLRPQRLSEAEKLIPVFPADTLRAGQPLPPRPDRPPKSPPPTSGGYPSGDTHVSDLKPPPPGMRGQQLVGAGDILPPMALPPELPPDEDDYSVFPTDHMCPLPRGMYAFIDAYWTCGGCGRRWHTEPS